jgi:hypothetical protein
MVAAAAVVAMEAASVEVVEAVVVVVVGISTSQSGTPSDQDVFTGGFTSSNAAPLGGSRRW